MIFHKHLVYQARAQSLDITTPQNRENVIQQLGTQKHRNTGRHLSDVEIADLRYEMERPDHSAACFSLYGVPPVIFINATNCRIGDPIWKHERIHYQLKRYRNIVGGKSGTFLILTILSFISVKNLKRFFLVTLGRYKSLVEGNSASEESVLRFLEELMNCALIDYSTNTRKFKELSEIDRRAHAKSLIRIRRYLKSHLKEAGSPTKNNIRIGFLSLVTRLSIPKLYDLIRVAVENPSPNRQGWD